MKSRWRHGRIKGIKHYKMHTREEKTEAFGKLLDVLDTLRVKCPWDAKQTNESLRPNTVEEVFELADALISDDTPNIRKELGDVLLHVAFYSKIAEEKGQFDIADVCTALTEKLIFRHPHIYGDVKADTAQKVAENWEEPLQVWDKVKEELAEAEAEIRKRNKDGMEEEFGDLLFAVINAARLNGVDPDNALEKTNRKFIRRFNYLEKKAAEAGRSLHDMTLAEMDGIWDEAKRLERQ